MDIVYSGNREILENIRILSTLGVGVSDSFVMYNKYAWTSGHGEARLYISSRNEAEKFFGENFSQEQDYFEAFVTKNDLYYYLLSVEPEYRDPQSDYRNNENLTDNFEKYINFVENMDKYETFFIRPASAPADTRFYIRGYENANSSDIATFYHLLREICFPQITKISIVKMYDLQTNSLIFRFRPYAHEYSVLNAPLTFEKEETKIQNDPSITEKQKYGLRKSRIGQGKYRDDCLNKYEKKCVITGIDQEEVLEACHLKPWIDSNNDERLSKDNSILLMPTLHKLLDFGFITFDEEYRVIYSTFVSTKMKNFIESYASGKNYENVLNDSAEYLEYHRSKIYRD